MPTQKTLREIIQKTILQHTFGCDCLCCRKDGKLNSAISEIKSLIKEKLPKKKEGIIAILDKDGKKYYKQEDLPKGAYNECLTEIEQILEAL